MAERPSSDGGDGDVTFVLHPWPDAGVHPATSARIDQWQRSPDWQVIPCYLSPCNPT